MQRKNTNALRRVLAGLLVVGTPLVGACSHRPPDAKTTDVTQQDVVAALEDTYGVHPGERRNHTKGTCAVGEFVGRPEAAVFSRSALFAGQPVPVVARFSLAGGDPDASDAEKSPRGMALEFRLPDGSRQHMTMLNTPTFFAAVPRTFLDKIRALKPDPATGKPSPPKLAALARSDPDSRGQTEFLAEHNPPPSYADSAYYGIHTFKFVDRDDRTTLVRWRFLPEDGERALSDAELASRPANFLESALIERTKQGPVRWSMRLTIGEADDPEDDPTVGWPSDRMEVTAGILTVTSAMAQKGAECERINYDPLVMADGIAPSSDRILLFRSPSYALSLTRRLQGQ
jgi:catalase